MEYPKNDFCTSIDSKVAVENYIDYIKSTGNTSEGDYILVANGAGYTLGTSAITKRHLQYFYNFWADENQTRDLREIINSTGTPDSNGYTSDQGCNFVREYIYSILSNFFCNSLSVFGENNYPILGNFQSENVLQKEGIYTFLKDIGYGTAPCKEEKVSIMEKFCESIMPDNIKDESLYISSNKDIYKWCGCFVKPSNFFAHFESEDSISCSPLCSNDSSIKIYKYGKDSTSTIIEPCIQTVCAIDEISIRSTNFRGNILFSQICPGCTVTGNCTCIIDSSVQGILDKIKTDSGNGTQGKVSFKQVCPNANCFLVNSDGTYKKLTCNTDNPSNTNKDPVLGYSGDGLLRNISEAEKFTTSNYYSFIFLFLIFIFFFIISLLALVEKKITNKKKNNRMIKKN